jgi:hypothetical protein
MYCPKCGGQNSEDTNFCRICGFDLSSIAEAVSGRLGDSGTTRQTGCEADTTWAGMLRKDIAKGFMGLGFILGGLYMIHSWGVWMLIWGFLMVGRGVSSLVNFKLSQPVRNVFSSNDPTEQTPRTGALTRPVGYANPPVSQAAYSSLPSALPSVTEGTTKIISPVLESGRESN